MSRDWDGVKEKVFQRGRTVIAGGPKRQRHIFSAKIVALGREPGEFIDDPFCMSNRVAVSFKGEFISTCGNSNAEFVFDQLQIKVVATE